MTKREICDERPTFAYYSGLGGLEARFIEYGVDDYLYLIAGAMERQKNLSQAQDPLRRQVRLHHLTRLPLPPFGLHKTLNL